MELERGHISSLNDLWHWNGDLENPLWAQKIQQQTYTSWPPQWQAPSGWASDADGGELWLAGDSGKMHDIEVDVTKVCTRPPCAWKCPSLFVYLSAGLCLRC